MSRRDKSGINKAGTRRGYNGGAFQKNQINVKQLNPKYTRIFLITTEIKTERPAASLKQKRQFCHKTNKTKQDNGNKSK